MSRKPHNKVASDGAGVSLYPPCAFAYDAERRVCAGDLLMLHPMGANCHACAERNASPERAVAYLREISGRPCISQEQQTAIDALFVKHQRYTR